MSYSHACFREHLLNVLAAKFALKFPWKGETSAETHAYKQNTIK